MQKQLFADGNQDETDNQNGVDDKGENNVEPPVAVPVRIISKVSKVTAKNKKFTKSKKSKKVKIKK